MTSAKDIAIAAVQREANQREDDWRKSKFHRGKNHPITKEDERRWDAALDALNWVRSK